MTTREISILNGNFTYQTAPFGVVVVTDPLGNRTLVSDLGMQTFLGMLFAEVKMVEVLREEQDAEKLLQQNIDFSPKPTAGAVIAAEWQKGKT